MTRVILLLLLSVKPADACSCGSHPSPKEAWQESSLIFIGSVEVAIPQFIAMLFLSNKQTAWVRVTEPFKGVKKDQILVLQDHISSCFHGFQVGTPRLFYLYPGSKPGTWVAPACSRNSAITDAADDFKFLRELPASAHGNRISGTVAHRDGRRPLAGVRVQATGPSTYETISGSQGLYEFRHLIPGAYTITIQYPKGARLDFSFAFGRSQPWPSALNSTQLEVTADSHNGIDFRIAPDTCISGRVLDPNGNPMKGVCLAIESLHASDGNPTSHSDCTETDGSYVLDKMTPGRYRIFANHSGQMSAAEPFRKLYYPGTHEQNKAGILTVTAGRPLHNIDLKVPALAPRIQLSGRLIFSNGIPVPDQQLTFTSNDGRYRESIFTDAAGSFSISILSGRPGKLTAQIFLGRRQQNECPQFEAKFNPNGHAAILHSTPYPIAADKSIDAIHVVFPFPSCDAWLKQQARQKH